MFPSLLYSTTCISQLLETSFIYNQNRHPSDAWKNECHVAQRTPVLGKVEPGHGGSWSTI